MVDVDTFKHAGQVDTIELYSAMANRALRVGIYRPSSDAACAFKLVKQIEFPSFTPGYNKVSWKLWKNVNITVLLKQDKNNLAFRFLS